MATDDEHESDHSSVEELKDACQSVLLRVRGGSASPAALRGLQIRARIFLDEHRRTLTREDAATLRRSIEEMDQLLRALPLRQ